MGELFSGENFYNNEVEVDFVRKTVNFSPIKDDTFFSYYILYFTALYAVFLIFSAYLLTFLCVVVALFAPQVFYDFGFGLAGLSILVVVPLVLAFFFSLMFFDSDWRANEYPKANHRWAKILSLLFFKQDSESNEKVVEVCSGAVVDKRFVIPSFLNIYLDYEASDDFARYIKNIRIVNNPDSNWSCVFEWYRMPVSGSLKIKYI
jgi:hypothetical protein